MDRSYVRITLRIPQELHKKMTEIAKEQDRSLNKQMVRLMQMGVDQQSKPAQAKKVAKPEVDSSGSIVEPRI